MQRPFTSGSRQAPDPFDQYLEQNNFYRKHTARDSSCLFRTISEQMYDTQLHHLTIRKKCVTYMRRNRHLFELQVGRDMDEYLDDMSKPKTYGTLVELRAASYVFQRNVFLFEPYTMGSYLTFRVDFKAMFRVFYTPERHFDSVFTSDYIKNVAICQSICYEILYKDLFKLPDVTFAVEKMLHSNSLDSTGYRTECNEDGYCTRVYIEDGRTFDFDLPENTSCILDQPQLCHFHNPDFPRFSEQLQHDLKSTKREDTLHKTLSKTLESFLPDKYISCVRQLLLEGITPFPYKVAKALDPNMYRNIEFDSWNEARKELKLHNWYNGDSNFKVGAKCHVKLCKSETDLYTCHIQEMSLEKGYCIVFVEELGEKRLVPYDSLKPLPLDQFKPWSLPYRLQRHIQKCSSYRGVRQFNYRLKVDEQYTREEYCYPEFKSSVDYFDDDDPKQQNCIYKWKHHLTHYDNFRAHSMEYCTMPLTVEHNRDHLQDTKSHSSRAPSQSSDVPKVEYDGEHEGGGTLESLSAEQETTPEGLVYPPVEYTEEYFEYGIDPSIIQTGPHAVMPNGAPLFYMCNAPGYTQSGGMYMPAPPSTHHMITTAQNPGGYYPQYYAMPPSGGNGNYSVTPSIHRRGQANTTPLTGRINYDVKKSVKVNGSDLPKDTATLRYFYNLGLEYHQKLNKTPTTDCPAIDSKEGILKTTPEAQDTKLDENGNNVEVKLESNTNVSTSNTNSNNYTSSNKTNNYQRRFTSRYFNNKERQNYRSGQPSNRYNQNDYNGGGGASNKGQKSNPNHQSQNSGPSSTPNSRNGSSGGNHGRPCTNSNNQLSVAEQGIQTSPMMHFGNADNSDIMQTPTSYNSNGHVVASYVSNYPQEYEQPPPQSSNVYMPINPSQYGIYAAPPTIGAGPVAIHSTVGYPYMNGPPPNGVPLHPPAHAGALQSQMTQTYYTASSEPGGPAIIDGTMEGNSYPIVGYRPPMQYYYNSPNGVPPSPSATGGIGPQAFWCIPPPLQTQPSPQPQAIAMMPPTNQTTVNRRDNQQKHQHSLAADQ